MSIKIIKPGVLTSLQDAGRHGYRCIGVGSAGAMDGFAMKVANYLCANNEDKAVMEINFPSPEIVFLQDAVISLAGADLSAALNDTAVPAWRTLLVKKDSVLKFNRPVWGARAYLAIRGGWQAERWLNSYSTHLKLGAGGCQGRALQKNDTIDFEKPGISFGSNKILSWDISANELNRIYQPSSKIRCIRGVEYALLEERSKTGLEQADLVITNQSDRMGYRLKGKPLSLQQPIELISSAVDAGTVQLLPDGNCIVLMADHQTTGGYPRIASVIKADLPKLAQAKPAQAINFTLISLQQAEDAFINLQQALEEIKKACHLNLNNYFSS